MFSFGDGPALRVTPPFSPSDVSGLELWLDGRDLVGADGAAISSWTKRNGSSGTNATQANGARQPIIKSGVNGLNGNPVARFDGVDDFLLATLNAGSTGFTIYIVGRSGASFNNYGTLVGSGGTGGGATNPTSGIGWAFAYGGATADGFEAGWGGPSSNIGLGNVTGRATNTAFSWRYRTNKAAWSIIGPNNTTPADASFPTGTFQCHIGCANLSSGVPTFMWNRDIAAILIYSKATNGTEDTNIRNYITSVWGV